MARHISPYHIPAVDHKTTHKNTSAKCLEMFFQKKWTKRANRQLTNLGSFENGP